LHFKEVSVRLRSFVYIVIAGLFVGSFLGCASIVSGTRQMMTFRSTPDDASVYINGLLIGKTPITFNLKRKSGQVLTFEKDGYKTLTLSLETRMNGWFWGNLVIGGLFGSTTDNATGAAVEYSPSQYMVTLQPSNTNRLETEVSKTQAQRVKEFIVTAYNNLHTDILKGSGQYLDSLLDLIKVSEDKRGEAITKLKSLTERKLNILDFADQVNATFPEK
jgi:hypothetical protein